MDAMASSVNPVHESRKRPMPEIGTTGISQLAELQSDDKQKRQAIAWPAVSLVQPDCRSASGLEHAQPPRH